MMRGQTMMRDSFARPIQKGRVGHIKQKAVVTGIWEDKSWG